MFFITGMIGPYMRPMAFNVPVAMLMSMVVAFTITPWLAYHGLRRKYRAGGKEPDSHHDLHDLDAVKQSPDSRQRTAVKAPVQVCKLTSTPRP